MVKKSLIGRINKATGINRSKPHVDLNTFLEKTTDYRKKLANRNYNFSTQIELFGTNSQARILAVLKTAISAVIEEAQTSIAKGGRMRVDTGFLRASGVANLNAPPAGAIKGDPKGTYVWNGQSISTTLANLKIGNVFYFGWTAHYAKYREAHDGFLEAAIMNWQSHVDKAVAYFKSKDGS